MDAPFGYETIRRKPAEFLSFQWLPRTTLLLRLPWSVNRAI
jgi:hypothetical protein